MKKQIVTLLILLLTTRESLGGFDPGQFQPPAPAPEPTTVAPEAQPITPTSKTKILPSGDPQIAPSTYFTPFTAYDANGNPLPVKQTTANKYNTTFPTKYMAKRTQASLVERKVSHPSGGSLLPGGLAGSFDGFLQNVTKTPEFLPYFQKIKVFILQNIYTHLMKVYTNFNMQHPKTLQEYIDQESSSGLNKKTLVINHLVNVIESQTNGFITQMFPGISKDKASWTGNFLMQHESTDLNTLLLDQEKNFYLTSSDKQILSQQKATYFSLLQQYLAFFKQYGALLDNEDTNTGMNNLVATAQRIAKEIENFTAPLTQALKQAEGKTVSKSISLKDEKTKTFELNAKAAALRNAKNTGSYLNPGLFFFDEDTFRGIKLIPDLAKRIGEGNYQKVGWPSQIVNDAKNGTPAQYNTSAIVGITEGTNLGYPIAFFKDANGNQTSSETNRLFVNMPNGTTTMFSYPNPGTTQAPNKITRTSLHEQELLKEPDWLNSNDGILKLLKACLGDFAQILGMGILDPCNEAILLKALNPGTSPTGIAGWQECQNYLDAAASAREKYYQDNPPQTATKP